MFSFQHSNPGGFRARPTVWLPALIVLVFACVYLPLASTLVRASTSADTVSAASTTPSLLTSVQLAGASKTCTPLVFDSPSQASLANAPLGLTVQADAPTQYQIYGNTASELRTQIERCAPDTDGSADAEFTGQTDYSLTWQYSVAVGDYCSLADVKVGVHTAIALPYWQPTSTATAGLTGRWQSFAASLNAHEQGHATLDKLYASKLLTDLNAIGPVDCTAVNSTVRAIANADVRTLNQANDNYDAQTNHGASQGAVLPTR